MKSGWRRTRVAGAFEHDALGREPFREDVADPVEGEAAGSRRTRSFWNEAAASASRGILCLPGSALDLERASALLELRRERGRRIECRADNQEEPPQEGLGIVSSSGVVQRLAGCGERVDRGVARRPRGSPGGSMTVNERTAAGFRAAASIEMTPPYECPTR